MKKKTGKFLYRNINTIAIIIGSILVLLAGYITGNMIFGEKGNNLPPVLENPETVTNEELNPTPEEPLEPVETPTIPIEVEPIETPVEAPEEPGEKPEIPEDKPKLETQKEYINYEIIEVEDSTLEIGVRKVKQEGRLGEKLLIYEVEIRNGVVQNRELVKEEIVLEVQNRIIHIGTKKPPVIEKKVEERVEEVPFEIIYVEDPTEEIGVKKVQVPGVNGQKTTKNEVTYQDGKKISTKTISITVTKEPISQIIIIGTKPVESIETPAG